MSRAQTDGGVLAVPVIDISPFRSGTREGRERVAEAVDRAAREVGFMQVVGHGVPEAAVAGLVESMDAFFALPMERKRAVPPPSPSVNRGYTPPKTERLAHSLGLYTPDDLFEALNIGSQASDFPGPALPEDQYPENLWPDCPMDGVKEWFGHAGRLARTMTEIFAPMRTTRLTSCG